ncbi:M1 family metallopeptidase [Umezawaea beigongshangensis]|uniref:M1 family metallopeptidase n=1 Tax=Umezawaea beigongshangensis TaxID=2780383 RepID=UPI0018F1A7D3|nr:M1 family metallopeptidase [Umezawaea beigongshangensis]
MVVSPRTRTYLVIVVVALLAAGVVVARLPVESGGSPSALVPATTGSRPPLTSAPPSPDGAGDPYYPQDGNGGYDVTGYDVDVSYSPDTRRLDGRAAITANATAELSRFHLDLRGLDVSAVTIGGRPATFTREGDHELVITPETPLPPGGVFTAEVVYGGDPAAIADDSLGTSGWQVSASGGAFAAGQPHSASTWYPVNDTPRDKATWTLSARVPDGWTAISNGLEGTPVSADGWTTFEWREETPIASYLTTVAIDRWTVDRSQLPDGTPVVDAYAPGAEHKRSVQQRMPEVLAFLAEKFGPYPQRAAGGIFLADQIGFSLETQTRPVYAGWAELETVVHEQAHQWFGDSVTIENWADICLNECLASYAQWLWDEAKQGGDLDSQYRMVVERSDFRSGYWERALYDMGPGREFEGVYDKGIVAMHALRRQIGDDAFFGALREWAALHRDGNASWPEFEQHVERVAGQDLDAFFAAWFRGTTKPADEHLYPGPLRR